MYKIQDPNYSNLCIDEVVTQSFWHSIFLILNFACPLEVNYVFLKFIKRIFNFICRVEERYFSNFLGLCRSGKL